MGLTPRASALAVFGLAAASIGAALVSQHVFGLIPCELCLLQRWPYYVGVPFALATSLTGSLRLQRLGLLLLALLFVGSAGLGVYHAGVEWRLWAGPSGCSGGATGGGSFADFAKSLDSARAVSCTDAAFRLFGISLAGWNAIGSLVMAALAASGLRGRA